jgi:DNA-binding HxlR family transcriptional regulator
VGSRVLALLAEDRMIAALRALADGPLRPQRLERELGAAHAVVFERLGRLLDCGVLSYEHQAGTPPRAHKAGVPQRALYGLEGAGRALLEVPAQGERWERAWQVSPTSSWASGTVPIKLLADQHDREILLALAGGALCTNEVAASALGIGRSALRRRLRNLVREGMLQSREAGRTRTYELTCAARHLASVALAAARWEWRWWNPEPGRPAGIELGELLGLIAPAAQLPERIGGVCRLHVQSVGVEASDIYLVAGAGALRALTRRPTMAPAVVGTASPEGWCDALLGGRTPAAPAGDRQLLARVIEALGAALSHDEVTIGL